MPLPSISPEQTSILNALESDANVLVDSVAGSGKTTTNLFIAKAFPDRTILLLTYNAKLKLETREKIQVHGLENMEAHSFHSFCVKHYDPQCYRDKAIDTMLRAGQEPTKPFRFDLIIIDEAQDMTPLYYQLVRKLYADNGASRAQLCVVGDKCQSIFDFNNADERFIVFADELFAWNGLPWTVCNLSTSYRITDTMSTFLNEAVLPKPRIYSTKPSKHRPRYVVCDCFETAQSRTYDEVEWYLSQGYKPDDIFVLAPSLKNNVSPARVLENQIKRGLPGVQVFVPTSDESVLDQDVLEGKMVFSTIHQSKGLERKVVLLFSFDNSYFNYYKTNANPMVCPNELYVGTTRALERLTLFHHHKNPYLPFLRHDRLNKLCDVHHDKDFKMSKFKKPKNVETSVTDLLRHIAQETIDICFSWLEREQVCPAGDRINIPLKTSQDNGCESVSEVNGIAIPAYFEYQLKKEMNILTQLRDVGFEQKIRQGEEECLVPVDNGAAAPALVKPYNLSTIREASMTPSELLYVANCWASYQSGYLFKVYQIQNYNWLSVDALEKTVVRMKSLNLSTDAVFEYGVSAENYPELLNRTLSGSIDCVSGDDVYEFKCVGALEPEHFLQVVLYMYLNTHAKKRRRTDNKKYYLFNILTGELWWVHTPNEDLLTQIVETLIHTKYLNPKKIPNAEFKRRMLLL